MNDPNIPLATHAPPLPRKIPRAVWIGGGIAAIVFLAVLCGGAATVISLLLGRAGLGPAAVTKLVLVVVISAASAAPRTAEPDDGAASTCAARAAGRASSRSPSRKLALLPSRAGCSRPKGSLGAKRSSNGSNVGRSRAGRGCSTAGTRPRHD